MSELGSRLCECAFRMRTCLFCSSDPAMGGGAGREKLWPGRTCLEGIRPFELEADSSAGETTTEGTCERELERASSCQSFPYAPVMSSKLYCEAIDTPLPLGSGCKCLYRTFGHADIQQHGTSSLQVISVVCRVPQC